jgi:magnesium chelatase family protein
VLACRLTTIVPPMTLAEALETTRIHSVAGLTGRQAAGVATRPCRAPHHPISDVGVSGGGQMPRPGEVSRAPHGLLCLDELPECTRHGLEVLRQPLEEGITRIQSPARPRPSCLRLAGRAYDDIRGAAPSQGGLHKDFCGYGHQVAD